MANVRAPHKPLLLLWLFGRFAAGGSSVASYEEAEEPVSDLINEFGPPVKSPSAARRRAAMPFVHLERELWDLRDGQGREIGPDQPDRSSWLTGRSAVGRLRPGVERLLSDRGTLVAAARLLLDRHFTPVLAGLICAEVNLDLPSLNAVVSPAAPAAGFRRGGAARVRVPVRHVWLRRRPWPYSGRDRGGARAMAQPGQP
jgi:putative restriction endonuclease